MSDKEVIVIIHKNLYDGTKTYEQKTVKRFPSETPLSKIASMCGTADCGYYCWIEIPIEEKAQ